jgi:hypothetical protein
MCAFILVLGYWGGMIRSFRCSLSVIGNVATDTSPGPKANGNQHKDDHHCFNSFVLIDLVKLGYLQIYVKDMEFIYDLS